MMGIKTDILTASLKKKIQIKKKRQNEKDKMKEKWTWVKCERMSVGY